MPKIAIMAFLFAALFSGYVFYLEYIKNDRDWLKLIISLVFFCGFVGFGLADILDRNTSSKIDKQEIIDTTVNSSQKIKDVINAAIDSTKAAIIDSIKSGNVEVKDQNDANTKSILDSRPIVDYKAFIDLSAMENNPTILYSKNEDTITCTIWITNYGNDQAINLEDKLVVITYIGGKPFFWHYKGFHFLNKSIAIPAEKGKGFYIPFNMHSEGNFAIKPIINPVFVYFRLDYTNSKNKRMNPFQKIFSVENNGFRNTSNSEYNTVKRDLISEDLI